MNTVCLPDNVGMTQPIPLLVFAGSTRAQSWNRKLAAAAATIATEQGAQVTHLELGDFDVPMYNADLEAKGTPRDVIRLKEIFHDHPAWIVCSPEYNGSYTGLMKNTLDWISSPVKNDPVWQDGYRSFTNKVVGLTAASPGALGGLRSLSHLTPLLMNLHCWVSPHQLALTRAAEAFDVHGQLVNENQRLNLALVIERVLWAARQFRA